MSTRLQVVLDEAEYAEIQAAARAERMTVSDWVRRMLRRARAAAGEVREPSGSYAAEGSTGGAGRGVLLEGLSPEVYERLATRAGREHRSIGQQAAWVLERALAAAEPTSLLELEGLGASVWRDVDAAEHVAGEREAWD